MKKVMLFVLGLGLTTQIMSSQWEGLQRLSPYAKTFLQSSKQAFGKVGTSAVPIVRTEIGTGMRHFSRQSQNLGRWAAFFRNRLNTLGNQFSYYMPQSMRNLFAKHHEELKIIGKSAGKSAVSKTVGTAIGGAIGTSVAIIAKIVDIIKDTTDILNDYNSELGERSLSELDEIINSLENDSWMARTFVSTLIAPNVMSMTLASLESIVREHEVLPESINRFLQFIVANSSETLGKNTNIKKYFPSLALVFENIATESAEKAREEQA